MWKEIKTSPMKTFQLEDHPELIHVIKTGHDDEYSVVHEDAYGLCNGGVIDFLTGHELEVRFGIKTF